MLEHLKSAHILMSIPRDQNERDRTGTVKAARIFSNLVSPPTIFAAVGMALAWHELPFWPGFLWAAVYGLTSSLLPIFFVLYLLKTGRIAELHMSNTKNTHIKLIKRKTNTCYY